MLLNWVDRQAWTNAIIAGIKGVDDETLARTAAMIARSSLVLTAGNGGSSAIASHAAQAFMKPSYQAGGGHAALCLNDNVPTLTAHANDGGWTEALGETAQPFFKLKPLLLLVSSSGRSKNIVHLAHAARAASCEIIAFTGFQGGALRGLATLSIHIDSDDYEVIEPAHDALLHRVQFHLRTHTNPS